MSNPFPDLRLRWREVTPKQAAQWLKKNTRNRRLSPNLVAMYGSDILRGRWGFSEGMVVFADDGRLINGQHRLQAIMAAKKPVWMVVAHGVPYSAIIDMDQGRRRSVTDAINLYEGDDVPKATHRTTAICKAMMPQWSARGTISHHDLYEFMVEHWDAVHWTEDAFGGATRGTKGVGTAPVLAAAACAYYHQNIISKTRLREWLRVMRTGEGNGPTDNAAIKFRNYCLSDEVNYGGTGRMEIMRRAWASILAFGKSESIKRLHPLNEDPFPLPKAA